MSTSTSAGTKKAEKETAARTRACLDGDLTHLRVGWWTGDPIQAVELLGDVKELHGSVCTCCPRRAVAS